MLYSLFVFILLICLLLDGLGSDIGFSHSGGDDRVEIIKLFVPENCNDDSRKTKLDDGIIIHYTGRFHDSSGKGIVFESSKGRGKKPLKFNIGSTSLIPGLSLGVVDMCIGERRKLVIPPELAYGKEGFPRRRIPGDTTIEFDVELVGYIGEKVPKPNVFKEMDTNGDNKISYEEMEIWFRTKHPKKHSFIPHGVWERDDKNQDFVITWEEFSGPKGEEETLTVHYGEL